MVKTAGLCYVETGEIKLSGAYLAKYPHRMLGEILTHETAHYIDFCLYGWKKHKRHHGKHWQYVMDMLGYVPEPYHDMEL